MVPRKVARISEYVANSGCSPGNPASGTAHSAGAGGGGAPSRWNHTSSSTIAGNAIAVSFTQYWKACTKVMLRIPPTATLTVTTAPTTTAPTQAGAPVTVDRVSPAPCSC